MIKAAAGFDPNRGNQFSTYACTVIRNEMAAENRRLGQERARMRAVEWEDFTGEFSRGASRCNSSTDSAAIFTHLPELLTDAQRQVLDHRYGLNGGESQTLHQVAGEMGCSHETVRRMEKRALKALRQSLEDAASNPSKRSRP